MLSENIAKEARAFALEEIKKFSVPNSIHFEISENKSSELADKFSLDKNLVLTGHALMDVKLGEAISKGKIKDHVKMSSDAAKEFLGRFNLSEQDKSKIINCIEAHHGAVSFSCKEAEICANADCYRFIHPKGFLVALTVFAKRGEVFLEALKHTEEKLDEKWKILSLDACKKELEEHYFSLKNLIKNAREA